MTFQNNRHLYANYQIKPAPGFLTSDAQFQYGSEWRLKKNVNKPFEKQYDDYVHAMPCAD